MQVESFGWYVVYVKSRCEKKVVESLSEKKIINYLPLKLVEKQWSDRIKKVLLPLFSGYVFVQIEPTESIEVLKTDNVVCFISINGKPVRVRDREIENIKTIVENGEDIDAVNDKFEVGDYVEIVKGKLSGVKGELIKLKGKYKLLIRVDIINSSILVNVSSSQIKQLNK
jgi:transcription antitermination factor NusG